MPPVRSLPFDASRFASVDDYVESLIEFSRNPLLRLLCGGVHILDFFTKDHKDGDNDENAPKDLYSAILPAEWRHFFDGLDMDQVLELLLRTPVEEFSSEVPDDLKAYVKEVRDHSLQREFVRVKESIRAMKQTRPGTERALYAGMKPKKVHEVEHFAAFVDDLVHGIPEPKISHILDYGSGQAYLSRTLAKKYSHNVLGLESRPNNIRVSQELDRRYDHLLTKSLKRHPTSPSDATSGALTYLETHISAEAPLPPPSTLPDSSNLLLISLHSCGNLLHHALRAFASTPSVRAVALIGCCHNLLTERHGRTSKVPPAIQPPSVQNHPAHGLRSPHPRVEKLSSCADASGFPISTRFYTEHITLNITARSMAVQAPNNWTRDSSNGFFKRHFYRALLQRVFHDLKLVDPSAPAVTIGSLRPPAYACFTSYARAAAEKMGWSLDKAVAELEDGPLSTEVNGATTPVPEKTFVHPSAPDQTRSSASPSPSSTASLQPQSAVPFPASPELIEKTDKLLESYATRFNPRWKDLSVLWTLMAFSAAVVESLIVVDRWMFLGEVEGIKERWVEAVFEYEHSPRNLVVVGVR